VKLPHAVTTSEFELLVFTPKFNGSPVLPTNQNVSFRARKRGELQASGVPPAQVIFLRIPQHRKKERDCLRGGFRRGLSL